MSGAPERRGAARAALRLLGALCLLGAGLLVLPDTPAAQRAAAAGAAGPRIAILSHGLAAVRLADRDWTAIRGVARNEGPGLADRPWISATLRAADGAALGSGRTQGLVGGLRVGETSPFEILVAHCCPETVAEVLLRAEAAPAAAPRYADLRAEVLHPAVEDGRTVLRGTLRNLGRGYLRAADSRVFLAFWRDEVIVSLVAATMPIEYGAPGLGQSHPPDYAYPWRHAVPAEGYDRVEAWTSAEAYPTTVYPVPLGAEEISWVPDPEAPDAVVVEARIESCGAAASQGGAFLLRLRGEAGVRAFASGTYYLPEPLSPGETERLEIRWSGLAPPPGPGECVELTPFAYEGQARRPLASPCGGPPDPRTRFLPALSRP